MAKKTRAPIQVRDVDGSIRRRAMLIAKRNPSTRGKITAAIALAVDYTEAAERNISAPLNFTDCTPDQLNALIIHGYDHYTRAAALTEYKRRIMAQQEQVK